MGYFVDAGMLIILYLFARKNSHRKQVRVILETVSFVLAAAVAIPCAIFCSSISWNSWFRQPMAKDITAAVMDTPYIISDVPSTARILEQLPQTVQNAAGAYGLSSEENYRRVERNLVGDMRHSPENIADILARPVIEGVLRGVICILFFFAALFLAKALAAFVENMIKSADRGPGNVVLCGVMGVFKGLVILMIFITALQLLVPSLPVTIDLTAPEIMDNSVIYRLFRQNNTVMLFLGGDVFPITFS
ncbi:MAG: hypothetical protein FWE86_04895 [Oscillospiraceae bacterium]|nr:hypothetical protein [Oscillospiraceae bacterium]